MRLSNIDRQGSAADDVHPLCILPFGDEGFGEDRVTPAAKFDNAVI